MKDVLNVNSVKKYVTYFMKWLIISVLIGCIGGFIGSAFYKSIKYATDFRMSHSFIVYFLPIFGFLIVFLYRKAGLESDEGTNTIFNSVRECKGLKFSIAPLIFVSSVLTHLGGGSAGREGAALQIGGSVASNLGKILRLKKNEIKIATVCGMSAVFSAIFGTPVTSAIFCIEVINVGLFRYTALFPCITASFTANLISTRYNIGMEEFNIGYIPTFNLEIIAKVALLSIGCAGVSVLICRTLNFARIFNRKYLKDMYTRIFISSLIIITATLLLHTTDYLGTGSQVIERAINEGKADNFAFIIKLILTAITLSSGFKGGEIVPSMFIGATFGCVFGDLIGLDPSFAAALGLIGVLCGAVNCPISSLIMSIEMFGGSYITYFAIICTLSYFFSGRYSLYKAQKIIYPKATSRLEKIDKIILSHYA